MGSQAVAGAGLGLRRAFLGSLADRVHPAADFLELAPENWIDVGGRAGRLLRGVTERYPLVCHGLSLNLGGFAPLDQGFLHRVRRFLDDRRVRLFSDSLVMFMDLLRIRWFDLRGVYDHPRPSSDS